MQNRSKILLFIATLALSSNLMAVDCPKIATIQSNTQFTEAHYWGKDSYGDAWELFSNPFNDQKQEWNVNMLTYLNAKTDCKAIKEGNEFFKTSVRLNDPIKHERQGETSCVYADGGELKYIIVAMTPPVYFPNLINLR